MLLASHCVYRTPMRIDFNNVWLTRPYHALSVDLGQVLLVSHCIGGPKSIRYQFEKSECFAGQPSALNTSAVNRITTIASQIPLLFS